MHCIITSNNADRFIQGFNREERSIGGMSELSAIWLMPVADIAPNTELYCSYGNDENIRIFNLVLEQEGVVPVNGLR